MKPAVMLGGLVLVLPRPRRGRLRAITTQCVFSLGPLGVPMRAGPTAYDRLMAGTRVLVVEDDPVIGAELTEALEVNGYTPALAAGGQAAIESIQFAAPDLVLLDLGLPDLDGVLVCRKLRLAAPDAVIVVLTARTEELDVVMALEAGADDYLTKPFRLVELMARLRAHLRRQQVLPHEERTLSVGALRVNLSARRAFVQESELALRPKEFDLLSVLAGSAGEVVTREELMDRVWDENWFGSTKTLDVHVFALRRKLEEPRAAGAPRITTVRGRGYRLEE